MNELLALLNQAGRECSQVFALEVTGQAWEIRGRIRKNWQSLTGKPRKLWSTAWCWGRPGQSISEMWNRRRDRVLSLSGQEEGNLFHALKFCEEKEIEEQVNALIDKMGDDKVYWRQSQSYSVTLLNTLMKLVWRYELDEKALFGTGENFYGELLELRTSHELKAYFNRLCTKIHQQLVCRERGKLQYSDPGGSGVHRGKLCQAGSVCGSSLSGISFKPFLFFYDV